MTKGLWLSHGKGAGRISNIKLRGLDLFLRSGFPRDRGLTLGSISEEQ
jgi:hypothetical protein